MDNFTYIDFIFLAFASAFCSIILFTNQLIHALSAFLGILILIALVFLFANAGFLFATQLLLYVGAVTVLFVFAIMLTKRVTKDRNLTSSNHNKTIAFFLALGLAFVFFDAFKDSNSYSKNGQALNDVKEIGVGVVSNYLFPFELLSIFLLIALVLAAVIAGKKQTK